MFKTTDDIMAGIVVDVDGWFFVTDHNGNKITSPISSLDEACDIMRKTRMELWEKYEDIIEDIYDSR